MASPAIQQQRGGVSIVKAIAGQPKAAKPDSKDDLKSLPLPEVERQLGSSPGASVTE